MKKFSLWTLLFSFFVVFALILFTVSTQALSRSPDKMPYGSGLILDIELLAMFQVIEKQFIYTNINIPSIKINFIVKAQETNVMIKDSGIAKVILWPVLLL